MTRPYALLRIGFSYNRTIGMRRLTNTPIDLAVSKDGVVRILCKQGQSAFVRSLSLNDEDLGAYNLEAFGIVPQIGKSNNLGGFVWPIAIDIDDDETLWISDQATHKISRLSLEGELIDQWGEFGSSVGQLNRPSGLSIDPSGDIWVSDTFNNRVQRFDSTGSHISTIGSPGADLGQFNMPWGIHADELGVIYVADWKNDRIQYFSTDGEVYGTIGKSGCDEGEFNRPSDVTVDGDGDIYVVDRGNNRVQLFGPDGNFVERFIGDATLGKQACEYMMSQVKALRLREMSSIEPQKRFRDPISVKTDHLGHMYVTDYGSHRVQIYKKEVLALQEHEIADPLRSPSLYTQF